MKQIENQEDTKSKVAPSELRTYGKIEIFFIAVISIDNSLYVSSVISKILTLRLLNSKGIYNVIQLKCD